MASSAQTKDISEQKLDRGLSNRHLQMIAIGGAIGTGLFFGSGKLISLVGPSVIFVYMIIGFVLFFVMRALGELLLSNLNYKTFGDIAKDLIGPWAGFFVSWNYWFSWVVACIADIVAITAYAQYFNPDIPVWLPALLTASALLILNLQPVKFFGETEFWFAIIKVVAILALIVVGLYLIFSGHHNPNGTTAQVSNLWNYGGFFPTGLSGFILGFQMGIFAFIGIELVGTTAAETENPHRNLPKAINSIIMRILVFYVGALSIIMMVTPWVDIDPEQSPFTSMFGMVGFTGAAFVVNLVVLLSAASSANSGVYSASRMAYSLGLDRHAPKLFARKNKRHVPSNAVFFTAVFAFLSIPLLLAGDTLVSAFTVISSLCSTCILFTWGSIVVSYINYHRKFPERHAASQFRMPLPKITPWFILAFFAFIVFALALGEDTRIALILIPLWFVVLTILWKITKAKLEREHLPVTGMIPIQTPEEIARNFENR
ncbi:amino acid permease [Rothia terrae]|uniref:Amino acid permease n=1 Tax=Rothia terrae TaxID=396015 RepID=A0A7H2BC17_9MICC|nr:amino acid permease [Rothia terrae]QNV37213.1 amino acid permease [Rothia terrae]